MDRAWPYLGITAAILLGWVGVLVLLDWATDGGVRRHLASLGTDPGLGHDEAAPPTRR